MRIGLIPKRGDTQFGQTNKIGGIFLFNIRFRNTNIILSNRCLYNTNFFYFFSTNETSLYLIEVSSVHRHNVRRWIPMELEFLTANNLSQTFLPDDRWFDGGGRIPCDANDREVTIIEDDLAVLDDGRLIVFQQHGRRHGSAAGMDAAEDGEWLTFSNAEYCVDRVSLLDNITRSGDGGDNRVTTTATARGGSGGGAVGLPTYAYVAWVCRPCKRITCVPKCCAKGFTLKFHNNKVVGCRKTQSTASAEAAIRLKSANGTLLHREYSVERAHFLPSRLLALTSHVDSDRYWVVFKARSPARLYLAYWLRSNQNFFPTV